MTLDLPGCGGSGDTARVGGVVGLDLMGLSGSELSDLLSVVLHFTSGVFTGSGLLLGLFASSGLHAEDFGVSDIGLLFISTLGSGLRDFFGGCCVVVRSLIGGPGNVFLGACAAGGATEAESGSICTTTSLVDDTDVTDCKRRESNLRVSEVTVHYYYHCVQFQGQFIIILINCLNRSLGTLFCFYNLMHACK